MEKNLKILFMEPLAPYSLIYGKYDSSAGNNTFPVGIASIARYIFDKGYKNVYYLEPNIEKMDFNKLECYIKKLKPDIVGIGSTTLQIEHASATFGFIKKILPESVTVLGGIHATLMPEDVIKECTSIDFLIAGEGEKPFFELLESITTNNSADIRNINGLCFRDTCGNVSFNPPDPSNRLHPDEIPVPLYNIFPMRSYTAQITFAKFFPTYTVITSRGCPYRCSFCNATEVMGRNVRRKSPENVIEEIKILKHEYGAKGIMFLDSTFTIQHSWVERFCTIYKKSGIGLDWSCGSRVDTINEDILLKMKDAGCWSIAFGIESANQKSLDIIQKGTTVLQNENAVRMCIKNKIFVVASYILCLPGENMKDAWNTVKFAKKLGSHIAFFYLPVPYPKTKLADDCKRTGILKTDAPWHAYNAWDWTEMVYINPLVGEKQMQGLVRNAFFYYYSEPKVLWRNLKEVLLMRQSFKKYFLAFKGFIKSVQ